MKTFCAPMFITIALASYSINASDVSDKIPNEMEKQIFYEALGGKTDELYKVRSTITFENSLEMDEWITCLVGTYATGSISSSPMVRCLALDYLSELKPLSNSQIEELSSFIDRQIIHTKNGDPEVLKRLHGLSIHLQELKMTNSGGNSDQAAHEQMDKTGGDKSPVGAEHPTPNTSEKGGVRKKAPGDEPKVDAEPPAPKP